MALDSNWKAQRAPMAMAIPALTKGRATELAGCM
jgi:hypothetical protein